MFVSGICASTLRAARLATTHRLPAMSSQDLVVPLVGMRRWVLSRPELRLAGRVMYVNVDVLATHQAALRASAAGCVGLRRIIQRRNSVMVIGVMAPMRSRPRPSECDAR